MQGQDRTGPQASHTDICLWLDYYGDLLTPRQKEVLGLYYEQDWSLSEIADLTGLSRQGVHNQIRKGADRLAMLEGILGLAARDRLLLDLLDQALKHQARADDLALKESLDRLQTLIKLGVAEAKEWSEAHGSL